MWPEFARWPNAPDARFPFPNAKSCSASKSFTIRSKQIITLFGRGHMRSVFSRTCESAPTIAQSSKILKFLTIFESSLANRETPCPTYQFVAAISPDTWNSSHRTGSYDFYSFRDFFIHALLQASRSGDGNRTAE